MEDSQLEDHTHEDSGHSHACSATSVADPHHHSSKGEFVTLHYSWGSDPYDPKHFRDGTHNTQDTTVKVSTTCSLTSETSGLGGVSSSSNSGAETRPINMKVIYVIRVY